MIMGGMAWTEVIVELAILLPDRVRLSSSRDSTSVQVRYTDYPYAEGWVPIGQLTDTLVPLTSSGLLFLEASLRETCEERGWGWWVGSSEGPVAASASVTLGARTYLENAPAPVEALALALLKGLKST
jgi:hypothetical protein